MKGAAPLERPLRMKGAAPSMRGPLRLGRLMEGACPFLELLPLLKGASCYRGP